MKYCYIDCETTGTDPQKHGLIQMAGKIAVDGKIVETFDIKAKPFPDDKIEEEAMEVNKVTKEMLRNYPTPREAYRQFMAVLERNCDKYRRTDKYFFVGYNGDFDADHVRAFMQKNGDNYFGSFFWFPVLDVAKLAGVRLMDQRDKMVNFRLMTVAQYLGIPVDDEKTHEAMYDIELTMKIFAKLTRDLPYLKEKVAIA
jgi:DNA polymerase-3 subunit epsilon